MIEIILAHLYEINCPMIVAEGQKVEGEQVVGFDFGSSRHLLVTCGWLMGVSNYFGQIGEKLILKKMGQIYKPKPLNLGALSEKYALPAAHLNLHEASSPIERVSYLAKTLKSRKYSV